MNRYTHTIRTGCRLVLALLAGSAAAEQIYRSVDAQGNVTYSSTPPASAVAVDEVSVQPGPSEDAVREARERTRRQEEAASEMGAARADRAKQQPPPATSAADTGEVEHEDSGDQYDSYPYRNTSQRDRVSDAVRKRLQERPVQLPARPGRR
jgi:hypothetical protein